MIGGHGEDAVTIQEAITLFTIHRVENPEIAHHGYRQQAGWQLNGFGRWTTQTVIGGGE
jgi:hypothetical protein